MENKITIQDLSNALSARKNISRKDAESFVKLVFDTISQGVVDDKLVKIKGLGTFKLVEVQDRESINVNTGERIIIPGHSKVSFTPDNTLRDQINRPFADFQTVILNEGTSTEEMERIDIPELIPEDTSAVDQEAVEPLVEQAEHEEEIVPASTQELEVDSISTVDDVEAPGSTEQTFADEIEPVKAEEPTVDSTEQEEQSVDKPQEELGDDLYTSSSQAEEKVVVREVIKEVVVERRKPISPLCYFLFGLFCLSMMVLSYFAGYYDWLCPCRLDAPKPKTEVKKEVKKVSTPVKKVEQKSVSTKKETEEVQETKEKGPKENVQKKQEPDYEAMSKDYAQVPNGKYLIVGTKRVHKMQRGDNLYKLARQEYGSNDFAQYIIVHNQFSNPDCVHLDYSVKMPELKERKQ